MATCEGTMAAPLQIHLPDRICRAEGSAYYHPIYSRLVCVYLNDVALEYVVEACRSARWAIKYELDDQGHFVKDHKGNLCLMIVRGQIEFYERKSERQECKVFLSDYT